MHKYQDIIQLKISWDDSLLKVWVWIETFEISHLCSNLMWVSRKTVPTSGSPAFIPSSSSSSLPDLAHPLTGLLQSPPVNCTLFLTIFKKRAKSWCETAYLLLQSCFHVKDLKLDWWSTCHKDKSPPYGRPLPPWVSSEGKRGNICKKSWCIHALICTNCINSFSQGWALSTWCHRPTLNIFSS